MSYLTVAEADALLGHSAAWAALDEAAKKSHLTTAALWLNFSYEWPGCIAACQVISTVDPLALPYTLPITLTAAQALEASKPEWPRVDCCTRNPLTDSDGCVLADIPQQVKAAQATAALTSVTTSLFAQPSTSSDGGLTKKLIKAGSVTIERQWSEPTRGSEGQITISAIDAMLYKIAGRRGAQTGRIIPV